MKVAVKYVKVLLFIYFLFFVLFCFSSRFDPKLFYEVVTDKLLMGSLINKSF